MDGGNVHPSDAYWTPSRRSRQPEDLSTNADEALRANERCGLESDLVISTDDQVCQKRSEFALEFTRTPVLKWLSVVGYRLSVKRDSCLTKGP